MKELELKVAEDHIDALTKVSPIAAMAEIIWNSLDADARNIEIDYDMTSDLRIEAIYIKDDGHGMDLDSAILAFEQLGGSKKKEQVYSPKNRILHGKAGKGRLRTLTLGDLVSFQSVYKENGKSNKFTVNINRNEIRKSTISKLKKGGKEFSGVTVSIRNLNQKNVTSILGTKGIQSLEEIFALYHMSYPDFKISIKGQQLDFSKLIKDKEEKEENLEVENMDTKKIVEQNFKFKVIEWNKPCTRKIYLCGAKGISYLERPLGLSTSNYPITLYILSDYVSDLHQKNLLDLGEMDGALNDVIEIGKEMVKDYVERRLKIDELNFFNTLKDEGAYPFTGHPKNDFEKNKRQIFHKAAIKINKQIPQFNRQHPMSKKLLFHLLKENINSGTENIDTLLGEVLN